MSKSGFETRCVNMALWLYLIVFIVIFKLYQIYTCGMCTCETKLTGKVIIVTGSNSTIGFETAKDLARRGARVILGCRDHTRGKNAQDKIIAATGNKDVEYKHLDLSSLASVRAFADDILKTEKRLDVLINNAGAAALRQKKTDDGLIIEYQINHFGPFLLTNLLLPTLKASTPSRIINVSSAAHWCGTTDLSKLFQRMYSDILVYCNTKLCNVLFTMELNRHLGGSGVVANCLHPGVVRSEIYRRGNFALRAFSAFYNNVFFKNEFQGAQTSIHLAVSPECEKISGQYFADCQPLFMSWKAKNLQKAKELWDLSARAVCLSNSDKL